MVSKNSAVGYIAFGLIIGIGLTVLLAIWFGEPSYELSSAPHPASQISHSQQGFGPFSPAFIVTQDTLAQWIMAVFAVLATAISIWAVYLIKNTLRATSDTLIAARDANEIMRLEQRPWLVIDSEMHGHMSINWFDEPVGGYHGRIVWGMKYQAHNKGKSPAFSYRVSSVVLCCSSWAEAIGLFEEYIENGNMFEQRNGDLLFSGERTQFLQSNMHSLIKRKNVEDDQMAVFIKLEYTDTSGTLKGLDARCYILQQIGPDIGPWIQEFRSVPDIRIIR